MKIGSSQRKFQPARESVYIYHETKPEGCSPIYGASAVRVSCCYFLFLVSVTTGKENENDSMKMQMQKFDHRSLIYGITGTKERVLVSQCKFEFEPLKWEGSILLKPLTVRVT